MDICTAAAANATKSHWGGLINYEWLYWCAFPESQRWAAVGLMVLCMLFAFICLGIAASDYFCPNLATLSYSLRLPQSVAGVTILAFGNGAPDLFVGFSSFASESAPLAIGELIGAGIFVSAVVVGVVVLVGGPVKLDKWVFIRDWCFYVAAMVAVLLCCLDGVIVTWEAWLLLILYILYVVVVVIGGYMEASPKLTSRKVVDIEACQSGDDFGHVDHKPIGGTQGCLYSPIPDPDNMCCSDYDCDSSCSQSTRPNPTQHQERSRNLSTISDDEDIVFDKNDRPSGSLGYTSAHQRSYYFARSRTASVVSDESLRRQSLPSALALLKAIDAEHGASYEGKATIEEDYGVKQRRQSISSVIAQSDMLRSLVPLLHSWKGSSVLGKLVGFFAVPAHLILGATIPVIHSDFHISCSRKDGLDECNETSPLLGHAAGQGNVKRKKWWMKEGRSCPLTALQINMVPMFVFWALNVPPMFNLPLPAYVQPLLISLPISLLPLFHPIPLHPLFPSLIAFSLCVLWIFLIATELVAVIKSLSNNFGVSEEIMGLTIFAVGNSVGDLAGNIGVSRCGLGKMAIGACYGGPSLNTLLSLSISVLALGNINLSASQPAPGNKPLHPSLVVAFSLLFVLLLFTLVSVWRSNWTLGRTAGWVLVGMYCIGMTVGQVVIHLM